MTRSLDHITFNAGDVEESDHGDFRIVHAYPLVRDWPAGRVSDAINPRSHDENVLDTPVGNAIRETLRKDPDNFVLMNRGILLLADRFHLAPAINELTVWFDGDPRLRGLADGGTTDACILSDMLGPWKAHRDRARVHVEIVVGLNDPDRVAKLVEGRNTSRQVQRVSLVNAAGHLDWLKEALPPEMAARIAWEENAAGAKVTVADALAVLAPYRPGLGRPLHISEVGKGAEHFKHRHKEHDAWVDQLPGIFKKRSGLPASLRDPAVRADFERVVPLATDLLGLADEVTHALDEMVKEKTARLKAASRLYPWNKAFPPVEKGWETPFTGQHRSRKVGARLGRPGRGRGPPVCPRGHGRLGGAAVPVVAPAPDGGGHDPNRRADSDQHGSAFTADKFAGAATPGPTCTPASIWNLLSFGRSSREHPASAPRVGLRRRAVVRLLQGDDEGVATARRHPDVRVSVYGPTQPSVQGGVEMNRESIIEQSRSQIKNIEASLHNALFRAGKGEWPHAEWQAAQQYQTDLLGNIARLCELTKKEDV
jgi:hypothetical protein